MIWLTWRQFRAQTIATAVVLVALAVTLLVTGINLAHMYNDNGLATCQQGCSVLAGDFINQVKGSVTELVFYLGIGVLYVAPGLIGMFWGAPLITRELETGTFRLAWNQSVSRTRWLLIKLTVIGLTAIATAGLLSLMVGWWSGPLYDAAIKAGGNSLSIYRFEPALFGAQGIVPLGYAAFAFILGVTIGLLVRRTIPAMALTLAVFAFIQLAWPTWVRPHLIPAVRATVPLNTRALDMVMVTNNSTMTVQAAVDKPGAWIISNVAIKPSGQVFTGPPTKACMGSGFSACNASIARLHLRQLVTYQPASRFWEFQWAETAIFLALAVLLGWFCMWRIRRRRLS
jgi:ABC-type transport system involved in multi-copper enzyme maturation permease subunit